MALDTTQENELNGLLTEMKRDGRTEDEMRTVTQNFISQYGSDDGANPEVDTPTTDEDVVDEIPTVDEDIVDEVPQPQNDTSPSDFVNKVRGPLFLEGYESQPNKEDGPAVVFGAESTELSVESLQNDITNIQAAYDKGDRHTKNRLGYDLRQKKKQLEKLNKEPKADVVEKEEIPLRQELQETVDVLKAQGYDDNYIQEVTDVWQMQDAGILPEERVIKPEDLPTFNAPADWSKPFNKKKINYGVLSPALNMQAGPNGEVIITGEGSPLMENNEDPNRIVNLDADLKEYNKRDGLAKYSDYANMSDEERVEWNKKYQNGELEIPLWESMKRSTESAVNRLRTIDSRVDQSLAMIVGKTGFTKGSYQYAKKTSDDLEELEEVSGSTLGFTDISSDKTGLENLATGIGAFYNATTSVGASAIESRIPGLLAVDMISTSVFDYNTIKAKEMGVDLATLSATGQTDIIEPTVIGAVSHQLEKIGLKGMEKYIKNIPTTYKKKILDFIYNGQVEGVTEYLQGTLEAYNNGKAKYLGQGLSQADATTKAMAEAGKFLTSKEALESYLQGVAGSSGTTILGAAANRRGNQEAIEDNLSKTSTIDGALSNKGLTQDEKTELKNTKATLEQEKTELKQEPYKELANVDAEGIATISKLNDELVSFSRQIDNTNQSENLTDEQKETVITQLENNMDKIRFQADSIIEQANEAKQGEYDQLIEDAKNKAVKAAKEKASDDSVVDLKGIGEEAENVAKAKIQKELDTQDKDPVKHVNKKFPDELASAPVEPSTASKPQVSAKVYNRAVSRVTGLRGKIRASKSEGIYTGEVKDANGKLLRPKQEGYISKEEGAIIRQEDTDKLTDLKNTLKDYEQRTLPKSDEKKYSTDSPAALYDRIVKADKKGFDYIDNTVAQGTTLTTEQKTKLKPQSDKLKSLTNELVDLKEQKARLETKDQVVSKKGLLGNETPDSQGRARKYDPVYGKPSKTERGYISIDPKIDAENKAKGLKPGDKGWKTAKIDTRKLGDRIRAIEGNERQKIGIDSEETNIKKFTGEIAETINKIGKIREGFGGADAITGLEVATKKREYKPETNEDKIKFLKNLQLNIRDRDRSTGGKGFFWTPETLADIIGGNESGSIRDLEKEVKQGKILRTNYRSDRDNDAVGSPIVSYEKKISDLNPADRDVARAYRYGKAGVKWVTENGDSSSYADLSPEDRALSVLKSIYLPKKVRKSDPIFFDDISTAQNFFGTKLPNDPRTPLQRIPLLSPHAAINNRIKNVQKKIDYLHTLPPQRKSKQDVDKTSVEYIFTNNDKIAEYQKVIDSYNILLEEIPVNSPILYRPKGSSVGYLHGATTQFEKPQEWDEILEKRDEAETEEEFDKYDQQLRDISPVQEWIGRSINAGDNTKWESIKNAIDPEIVAYNTRKGLKKGDKGYRDPKKGYTAWFKDQVTTALKAVNKFDPSKDDASEVDPEIALDNYRKKRTALVANPIQTKDIPKNYTVESDPQDFQTANNQRSEKELDRLLSNKEIKQQLDDDIANGDISQNYQKPFVRNTPKAEHFSREFNIQANRTDSTGATLKFGYATGNEVVSSLPRDASFQDKDRNKYGNIKDADLETKREITEGILQVDKNGNLFKSAKVYIPRLSVDGKDTTPSSDILVSTVSLNLATDNLEANVYEAMLHDRMAKRDVELAETTFDVQAVESTKVRAKEEVDAKAERNKLRKTVQNSNSKQTSRIKAVQRMHDLEAEFPGIVNKGRETAKDYVDKFASELNYTLKKPNLVFTDNKEDSYLSLANQIKIRYANGDPITITSSDGITTTLEETAALENLDGLFGKLDSENAFESGWETEQQAALSIAKRAKGFKLGGWNEAVQGNIAASNGNLAQAKNLWAKAAGKVDGGASSADFDGTYVWTKNDQKYYQKVLGSVPTSSRPAVKRAFKAITGRSVEVAQKDGTISSLLKKHKKDIIKRAKAEGFELSNAPSTWHSEVNRNELIKDLSEADPNGSFYPIIAMAKEGKLETPMLLEILGGLNDNARNKYPKEPGSTVVRASKEVSDWFDVRVGDGLAKTNAILELSRKFLSGEEVELISTLTGIDQAIKQDKIGPGNVGNRGVFSPGAKIVAQQQMAGNVVDTLLHENTHVWFEKLKAVNPALFNKLFKIINKDAGFQKWVKYLKTNPKDPYAKYVKDGDLETLINEYFAFQTGSKGAKIVKDFDSSTKSRIKAWVGDLLKFLGNKLKFNKNFNKIEDYSNAALRDVLLGESNIKTFKSKPTSKPIDNTGADFSNAVDEQFDKQFNNLKEILAAMNPNKLKTREERQIAEQLLELDDADLRTITTEQFDKLLNAVKEINAGEITTETYKFIQTAKAVTRGMVSAEALKNNTTKPGYWSKTKKYIRNGDLSALAEKIRSTPTFFVDEAFGLKGRTFYNNTFGKLASKYSNLTVDKDNVSLKLDAASESLKSHFKGDTNKIAASRYKLMTYKLQRKFESNINNPDVEVYEAADFVQSHIDDITNGTNKFYGEGDLQIFKDLLKQVKNKSSSQIKELFDPVELKTVNTMDAVSKEVQDKTAAVAKIARGKSNIENDVQYEDVNTDTNKNIDTQYEEYISTGGQSLYDSEIKGPTPINFDPLNSLYRAANKSLMDFHMTPVIQEINLLTKTLVAESHKNGSEGAKLSSIAISEAVNLNIKNIFDANMAAYSVTDKVLGEVKKLGYLGTLASPIRATVEYGSNVAFVVIRHGKVGNLKSLFVTSDEFNDNGREILNAVGSEHTDKLYSREEGLTGKLVEKSIVDSSKLGERQRAASNWRQNVGRKTSIIGQSLVGKGIGVTYKKATDLATKLLSKPDKAISRPLWENFFKQKYKELSGNDPDFNAIAANDETYMVDNAQMIKEARIFADAINTEASASSNPFNTALKHQINPNDSVYRKLYVNANNFMSKFLMFEAANALTGVKAMVGKGELTRIEGTRLSTAIVVRATGYTMGISASAAATTWVVKGVAQALGYGSSGDDDEEELSFADEFKLALAGSMIGLATGKAGQVVKIPMSWGVEYGNETLGGFMRNDLKYDSYKHSLMFSNIGRGDLEKNQDVWDYLPKLTGAYGNFLKPLNKLYKSVKGSIVSKKKQTREKHLNDIFATMALEGIVKPFATPLYRDINREYKRWSYEQGKKNKGRGKSRKATRGTRGNQPIRGRRKQPIRGRRN